MERLQKVLAAAGIASRRQCEELIAQGRISVDNEIVKTLGSKVDPEKQVIKCDGEIVKTEKKVFYLFNKPKGCICSNAFQGEEPRVIDFFSHVSFRLFTVGRLDKDTEGLILITNDGTFAQTMMHPKYQVDRVYKVVVKGRVTFDKLNILKRGVWLSEGKIVPEFVKVINSSKQSSVLKICVKEGKNREIRRIFAKIGHPVSNLIRIKFGPFELGNLKKEKYLKISYSEVKKALEDIKKQKNPEFKKYKKNSKQEKKYDDKHPHRDNKRKTSYKSKRNRRK